MSTNIVIEKINVTKALKHMWVESIRTRDQQEPGELLNTSCSNQKIDEETHNQIFLFTLLKTVKEINQACF